MSCCSCDAGINPAGSGGNNKVKVDGADTTPDFLFPKLAAGTGINLTILNVAGDEQVEINATGVGSTPVDEHFFAIANQTVFTLGTAPAVASAVQFYVNGVKYVFGIDYTVVGTTVTWLNGDFNMEAGDTVDIYYTV